MERIFTLNQKDLLNSYIDDLLKENKDCIILVKNDTRSQKQNRWYHGYLLKAIRSNLKECFKQLDNETSLNSYFNEHFALVKYGTDYFEHYTDVLGNKYIRCKFNKSFAECNQKTFNEFIDFIEHNKLKELTDFDSIDSLLLSYDTKGYNIYKELREDKK